MQVTTRSQNSPDDTSQEAVKQEEGGSGAEPGETPPVAVPPVIPLPEDRAAALDELCRSLDGSDERVSRSITVSAWRKAFRGTPTHASSPTRWSERGTCPK